MKTSMGRFFYYAVMVYTMKDLLVCLAIFMPVPWVTDVPYMMTDMPYIHLMDCEGSTPFHQPEKL
jgi:hypothetical protein